MIKPILFSTTLLFFVACGENKTTVADTIPPPPTATIPEKVDGSITVPDTLPPQVLPEAEKKVEEKVIEKTERPTKNTETKQTTKPGKPVLHGSWTLEKVYGAKEPFNMLFPNDAPDITFDLKTNTISGKNGCNSYNGPFQLKNGILSFGDMISTRMFCSGVNEKLFMTTLKMANNYRIDEDGKLRLKLDDGDLMLFKRQ